MGRSVKPLGPDERAMTRTLRQWIAHFHGRCQQRGPRGNLTIDHLTYARLGDEHQKDVQVLCCRCHHARHHITGRR